MPKAPIRDSKKEENMDLDFVYSLIFALSIFLTTYLAVYSIRKIYLALKPRYKKDDQIAKAIKVALMSSSYATIRFYQAMAELNNKNVADWANRINEAYSSLRTAANEYTLALLISMGVDPQLGKMVMDSLNKEILALMKSSMEAMSAEMVQTEVDRWLSSMDGDVIHH